MAPVNIGNLIRWLLGLSLSLGIPWIGMAQPRDITLASGAREARLSVEPVVDAIVEGEEFVTLELVDDSPNYVLAPQRVARMSLGDLTPPPDLLGFAPASGLPGTLVTLRGHSLDQTTVVTFNGVPAVFTVDSPYQVTATVPTNAVNGPISLATPSGAITSTGTFTVLKDGEWPNGWVDRNWSDLQRSDSGFDLNSVTYADGLYVAVGEFGIIRTSPDGQKWTMQESGYLGDLYGVAAGKINGVNWFVAVGGGATREAGGVILTSVDGLNWNLKVIDRPMTAVGYGAGAFVVGGQNRVGKTVDGVNWEFKEAPRQDSLRETFLSIVYGGGNFYATSALQSHDGRGHRIIWKSKNGIDWVLVVGRTGELDQRIIARSADYWYRYGAIGISDQNVFLVVGYHSNGQESGNAEWNCKGLNPNNYPNANSFVWCGDFDHYTANSFWNSAALDNNSGSWAHYSQDGVTWAERSKPDQVGLFGLAYGDDTFVAVGNGGAIRLTSDGQFWQSFQAPTVERLRSVVYGGGQFLAVGRKGVVVTSKSGVEWAIARPSASPFNYWSRSTLTGVASGPMGLVAVGTNQTVLKAAGGGQWIQPLRAGGSEFISGSFTYSEAKTDSVQRGGRVARVFPAADGTSGLAAGWLAGTDQGTEGTWRWDGTTNIFSNIPWALQQPDGAAGENNLWWNGKAAEDRKATDKGGYFIEYPDNQLAGDFRSVASGAGQYVIVGSKTVLSSSDLKIWRHSAPETTNDFTKVRFLNGQFMALGVGGALRMSSDGITWASRTSGVSTALLDGAYGAGRYIAVGESGAIVGSVDGLAWEKFLTGVTTPLRAIAYGNGIFVAVGDGGVVLTSETGTGWRLRASSGKTFRFLEFADNRFIAGDGSAVFQSTDGRTWEPWSRHRDFTSIYDRKRTFNALWVGDRSAWLVGEYATILQSSEYLPTLPAISLQLGEGIASEVGPRAGTFILRRSGDLSKPLTIRVKIGGTAVEPDDYVITGPILR